MCIIFFLYSYNPPLKSPIEDRGPPETQERSRSTHLLFVYLYEPSPLIERRRRVWDLIYRLSRNTSGKAPESTVVSLIPLLQLHDLPPNLSPDLTMSPSSLAAITPPGRDPIAYLAVGK